MATYERAIIPNVILNVWGCHFVWHWSAVPLGALCLKQQVGSTDLSLSQRVHGCLDWVWLLGSGANSGLPEGQACCPIKQRDLQTGSGLYPGNGHCPLPRTMRAPVLVVIETAGLHSLFISFHSSVPITWPRWINLNNRSRGSVKRPPLSTQRAIKDTVWRAQSLARKPCYCQEKLWPNCADNKSKSWTPLLYFNNSMCILIPSICVKAKRKVSQ